MQQDTRQKARVTMRHALQYSARVANAKDASEAMRMVDAWLVGQRLSGISAAPPNVRRGLPTVQWVADLVDLVNNARQLIVVLIIVAIAIAADLNLKDIFGQLK